MSGRVNQEVEGGFAPLIVARIEGQHAPFVGITTDGVVRSGMRSLDDAEGADCADRRRRARVRAIALSGAASHRRALPIDAPDWRTWTNVHVAFWRHGVMLDDAAAGTARPRARRSCGRRCRRAGYEYATGIMELNELVAQLKDDHDSYGQWLYFLSIYGDPGRRRAVGLADRRASPVISTVVFDGRIVTTPTFMGSEPRSIGDRSWFDLEEEAGLLLMRSLDDAQRTKAQIYPSITKADMPDPELQNPFDGRQVGAWARTTG